MTDQLKLLPPFTWRGEQYPVTGRSFSFAHESVQHKLQRRNQELVEQTGAHNPVITYTIPMREDLFPRLGYQGLFTERLQTLLDDCRNKEPGDLFDPVYGYLRCVPTAYNDDIDANKRDGVDLRIEFRHDPEDEEEDIVVTPIAAANEAAALEVEAQDFQVEAIEAEEIAPNRSIKLTEALQGLSNAGRAILATPNDLRSQIRTIEFWAHDIEDIVSDANELPETEALLVRDRARTTRDKARQVLENSLLVRPVRTHIVEFEQSVASLAAQFGVSFEAFLRANPSLSNSPLVPVGSNVVIPDADR